jgi:surface protein
MVFKKSNGVTNEYIGELPDDSPIPFFAQDVSGNSYAVMTASYNNNMYLIQSYENNTFIDSFKHNGELIPFNRIVTTFMTNMSSMFENNAYFNEDITTWDTSSVTDMTSMFNNCTNFNQNISWWDVSNVQSMFSMFRNASSFNANISSWDTSNVTSMAFMFYEALAFHQNIRGWDTSRVTDGDEQVVFGSPLQYTVNVPFFRTVTNISVLSSITKTTADGPFEFIPTSNSPAPFHFTSSNTKIATVSGNTVTLLSPGSTTITVIQDPYTDQDESTYTNGYTTTTLTVTKGLPSITLSHLTKILGSDPFQLDAVSNSNGALHYSINNPNVATVSGNTVTIVGNGTATITVTQEESKNFQVGSTTATLTVTVTLA